MDIVNFLLMMTLLDWLGLRLGTRERVRLSRVRPLGFSYGFELGLRLGGREGVRLGLPLGLSNGFELGLRLSTRELCMGYYLKKNLVCIDYYLKKIS